MSKIEKQVADKIMQRAEFGKKKYGVTMDKADLSFMAWINHLQEELMDATVYIEKLVDLLEKTQKK